MSSKLIQWYKDIRVSVGYWHTKKKVKPIHERHQWALNPFTQGIYWALTFLLAAAASLFTNEIKGGETFAAPAAFTKEAILTSLTTIDNGAYLFFFLAFVSALFFAYTAWVKATRENFMFHTMQTNPPQGFWQRYESAVYVARELHDEVQEIVFNSPSTEDIEKCQLAVRVIQDHIINLVMEWDTANIERKVTYRANVMDVVYFKEKSTYVLGQDIVYTEDANPKEADVSKTLSDLERFLHQPIDSHYSGVIVLNHNRYTTTTNTPDNTPDDTIRPIALPFCLQQDNDYHKFQTNLRGAPYCVASDGYDYVENVTKITDHYAQHADPKSERIRANLKKYYSLKENPAQSILSIPLKAENENGTQVIRWVLNIYRDQPGMLYNQEKNKQFTQIISSLTTRLQDILDMIACAASVEKPKGKQKERTVQQTTNKVE